MRRVTAVIAGAVVLALPGVALAGDAARTRRVSESPEGKPGNNRSFGCDVAEGGVAVAFDSFAGNLVPGDTNGESDIFVAGESGGVERVSFKPDGSQTEASAESPVISADGRWVAYVSHTYDLERGGNRNRRMTVFLHDRRSGRTTRPSDRSDGRRAFGSAYSPSISASGRYVAFVSAAPDLAMRGDDNGVEDIFVHDRRTKKTNRVSLSRRLGDPNSSSSWPDISADGRYVAFSSIATNLVRRDRNESADVFVYDRVERRTEIVSIASDGTRTGDYSWAPSISADGRYVAFASYSALAPTDAAGEDIYLHDRRTGTTEHVSTGYAGPGDDFSDRPSISADGRYVAFHSRAGNLVPGDTNGVLDVFVRDRVEGTTARVSVGDDGQQGNAASFPAALSPDGRYACWMSASTNLDDEPDEGDAEDVFVRGPLS